MLFFLLSIVIFMYFVFITSNFYFKCSFSIKTISFCYVTLDKIEVRSFVVI